MNNPMTTHYERKAQDEKLSVDSPVVVRWGYGLNFRAEATGKIVKMFAKSVQVEIDHDVKSPHSNDIGWKAGFVLKGIPRYSMFNDQWNYWNCVEPIETPAPVQSVESPSRFALLDD